MRWEEDIGMGGVDGREFVSPMRHQVTLEGISVCAEGREGYGQIEKTRID
jgi:hypothetical protein